MIGKKGDFKYDEFLPWLIGLACLAAGYILYKLLFEKSGGALEYLKNSLRFG